jgi:cell division transport system permease protein
VQWIPYVTTADLTRLAPVLVVVGILLAAISSVVTLNRYTRV